MCRVDWIALGTWVEAGGTALAGFVAVALFMLAIRDRWMQQARRVWVEPHKADGSLADGQTRELAADTIKYTLHNDSEETIFRPAVGVEGYEPQAAPFWMLPPNSTADVPLSLDSAIRVHENEVLPLYLVFGDAASRTWRRSAAGRLKRVWRRR